VAKSPTTSLSVADLVPLKVIFPSQEFPSAIPTQEKVREVLELFVKNHTIFDDYSKNVNAFMQLFYAPTSYFWEIPGKGLFYFTDVIPKHMGFCHLVVYHKDAMRQYGLLKTILKQVMDHPYLQLKRMNAFIPSNNRKAIWLARSLGFRREGLLREWSLRDGRLVDIVALGLLRKELEDG